MKEQYIEQDIEQIIREQFKGNQDAYLSELAKIGISPKRFREMREKMLIVQFMRQANTGDIPPPTPQEVENFYKENNQLFRGTPSIKLSSLSLPKVDQYGIPQLTNKRMAEQLRKNIISGEKSFSELASSYSKDSMAEKGGSWGWVGPQDLSIGLSAVAFALPQGKVSKVLDHSGHYVLLYVDERKKGALSPLSDEREKIEKSLRARKGKEMQGVWLDSLRADAMIKKNQS